MITLGSLCLHAAQLMKHAKYSSSDSPLQNCDESVQFGLINTTENKHTVDQNGNCFITLNSVEVRSSVNEDIANVSIIQMYENKSEEIMEVQYCFPIHPDGGTFVRFKAEVDGESVRDVSKLEVADEDNNNSSGLADGVLEFINWILKGNKPAIFKVPICSVNPGSFVQIRLGYEYKLKNYSNTLQFFIPKSIVPVSKSEGKDIENNEYSAAHLSIKVNVLVKGSIESLESPSHPGIVVAGKIEDPVKKGWTQAQVKFSGDSRDMESDFLLLIKKDSENEYRDGNSNEAIRDEIFSSAIGSGVVAPSIIKPSLDAFGGVCYDSVETFTNFPPSSDGYNDSEYSPPDMLLPQQSMAPPYVRGSVDYSIMKALEAAYISNAILQSEKLNVAKETVKSQNYEGQSLFNNSSSGLESIEENELSEVDSGRSGNIEEMAEPEENTMSQLVEDFAIESSVSATQDSHPSDENQDQFVEGFQSFHEKSGVYIEKKKSISNVDDADQNKELVVENIAVTDDTQNLDLVERNNPDESVTSQQESKETKTPDAGINTTAKVVTQKKFNFSQPRTTKLQISRANLIAKSSLAALAKKLNENDEGYQQKAKLPYRKPSPMSTTPTPRPATSTVNRTPSYSSTLKKSHRGTNSGSVAANRSPSLDRKRGNNVTFANANPPKPLVSDKDVSKILINLQSASGSFELSPILTALLSQDLDQVRQTARDNGWADSSVATAMSLAFLNLKLTDQKSSWNSAFEKGKKWLYAHFPKKADQIMEYMNQNIFHE